MKFFEKNLLFRSCVELTVVLYYVKIQRNRYHRLGQLCLLKKKITLRITNSNILAPENFTSLTISVSVLLMNV